MVFSESDSEPINVEFPDVGMTLERAQIGDRELHSLKFKRYRRRLIANF